MSARYDCAIVGAGPAGAALATLLARAGWSVALIERQRFPRRKVCGECIAPTNLRLLDALGIGPEFRRLAGAELRRVALMRGADTLIAALPRGEGGAAAYGRALGREHLDTLLAAAAERAGALRLQPFALREVAGEAGRWRLSLRRPAADADGASDLEIEAAVLVAAHGSWEPLPSERAARRAGRAPSDLFAFKANFRNAAIAPDLLPVLAFDGGYGGMVVADDGLATLACCIREDALERARASMPGTSDDGSSALPAGAAVEAWLGRECAGVGAALAGATREGAWLATGPIRPGVRLGQRDGVFRVGNAAGEAHPIVGEGISMALQSAFMLASMLGPERAVLTAAGSAKVAQSRALARYESLWRRRFVRRLQVAAAFAHVAMRPWAAAALWPLATHWPAMLTYGARWSGKTRCVPEAAQGARSGP